MDRWRRGCLRGDDAFGTGDGSLGPCHEIAHPRFKDEHLRRNLDRSIAITERGAPLSLRYGGRHGTALGGGRPVFGNIIVIFWWEGGGRGCLSKRQTPRARTPPPRRTGHRGQQQRWRICECETLHTLLTK